MFDKRRNTKQANELKRVFKSYDFENPNELYQYVSDSLTNGQREQARTVYNEIPGDYRQDCQNYLIEIYSGSHQGKEHLNELFNLLDLQIPFPHIVEME